MKTILLGLFLSLSAITMMSSINAMKNYQVKTILHYTNREDVEIEQSKMNADEKSECVLLNQQKTMLCNEIVASKLKLQLMQADAHNTFVALRQNLTKLKRVLENQHAEPLNKEYIRQRNCINEKSKNIFEKAKLLIKRANPEIIPQQRNQTESELSKNPNQLLPITPTPKLAKELNKITLQAQVVLGIFFAIGLINLYITKFANKTNR